MQKGKFITIDGIEGAGKSSQVKLICDYLEKLGKEVILTREPGGSVMGEKIRQLLLSQQSQMHNDTELLLIFAARCEHVHSLIMPALNHGKWVVSDRFTDASYAYQGGGRGLNRERIAKLEHWTLNGFEPNITFLLDLPTELGISRIESRGEKDRIELERIDFFNRVRNAYINQKEQFPKRIQLIDASQSIEHTWSQVQSILDKFCKIA